LNEGEIAPEDDNCLLLSGKSAPWMPFRAGLMPEFTCHALHTIVATSIRTTTMEFCKAQADHTDAMGACFGSDDAYAPGSTNLLEAFNDMHSFNLDKSLKVRVRDDEELADNPACTTSLETSGDLSAAIPGCGQIVKRGFNVIAQTEVEISSTITGTWSFNVRTGDAFNADFILEDASRKRIIEVNILEKADGAGISKKLVAGVYTLRVIALYVGDVGSPSIDFVPPEQCTSTFASGISEDSDAGVAAGARRYFEEQTSYQCGAFPADPEMDFKDKALDTIMKDKDEENLSGAAEFDGAFFAMRMSVDVMKTVGDPKSLLDLSGNFIAFSGAMAFMVFPKVEIDIILNPGKTGGLSAYFGVHMRFTDILYLMMLSPLCVDPVMATVMAGAIASTQVLLRSNKKMAALDDAGMKIAGTLDVSPIDFTVLKKGFKLTDIETAVMLGLEFEADGFNMLIKFFTGSVQKSVADFIIPMIVIYEKIMEVMDALVEGLKITKDKLKEASAGLNDVQNSLLPLLHKSNRGRARYEEIDRNYQHVKRVARGEGCHEHCEHGHWRCCGGSCKDLFQRYRPEGCRWRWGEAIYEEGKLWIQRADQWVQYEVELLAYNVASKGISALKNTLNIAGRAVTKAEEEISAKLAEASKNAPGVGKLMQMLGIPEKDRYLESTGQTNTKAIRAKLQRELNIFSLKELSVTTVFVVGAMAFKAQASLMLFGYDIDLIFAFSVDPKRLMVSRYKLNAVPHSLNALGFDR
jgi:hypothetical protein